jgi:hypothetical protein
VRITAEHVERPARESIGRSGGRPGEPARPDPGHLIDLADGLIFGGDRRRVGQVGLADR